VQAEYAPDGGYIPRVMFADATGKLAPLIKNPNASPQCAPHCSAASAALCACFCGGPSRPCCHSTRVLQARGSPLAACAGMATSTSPSRRCALRCAAISGFVMQAATEGFSQATEPLLAAPRQIKKGMEEALKAFTFALSNQMAAEANAAVAAGQTPVDAAAPPAAAGAGASAAGKEEL